jgi:hypothetical protein
VLYAGGPPSCARCGGALRHEADVCLCGGRSEHYPEPEPRLSAAEAREQLEARRHPAGSWDEMMAELRARYVGP